MGTAEPVARVSGRPPVGATLTLDLAGLDRLIARLAGAGYRTMGPVVRDGAIVAGDVAGVDDLPRGVGDEQSAGRYRLVARGHDRLFDWAVGPGSWKPVALPAHEDLWRARRDADGPGLALDEPAPSERPVAIVGARPCDAAALEVLDRVLLAGAHRDDRYGARRASSFLLVAECTHPSDLCFCPSVGTGPDAHGPFDLALTEVGDGAARRFVVRVGSARGAEALGDDGAPATSDELAARARALDASRARMARTLDAPRAAEVLARNAEHPRWDEVAERCLACGSCTQVCPTCFCVDVRDATDLAGAVTRSRRWSSCFDVEHSFLHGGPVRASTASRYRQWLTHKLSTWGEQFDTTGCVGCGRCVAWCPVGIDLLEEVDAISARDGATRVVLSSARSAP